MDAKYLNLRVYYIHPSSMHITQPDPSLNVFQHGMRLAASFSSAHVRQTTFTDFSFLRLDDREAIRSALTIGSILEDPKRWVVYRNKVSFSDFVNPSMEQADSPAIEKIVMVVSSIFLILFFAGFMACLVLQPGSVVYQGNGIILHSLQS